LSRWAACAPRNARAHCSDCQRSCGPAAFSNHRCDMVGRVITGTDSRLHGGSASGLGRRRRRAIPRPQHRPRPRKTRTPAGQGVRGDRSAHCRRRGSAEGFLSGFGSLRVHHGFLPGGGLHLLLSLKGRGRAREVRQRVEGGGHSPRDSELPSPDSSMTTRCQTSPLKGSGKPILRSYTPMSSWEVRVAVSGTRRVGLRIAATGMRARRRVFHSLDPLVDLASSREHRAAGDRATAG